MRESLLFVGGNGRCACFNSSFACRSPVPTYPKCNTYVKKVKVRGIEIPIEINKKIVDTETDTLLPFIRDNNEFRRGVNSV
jgi:hypothetical protein